MKGRLFSAMAHKKKIRVISMLPDLPFDPELLLYHDVFKRQKIQIIASDNPEDIYKLMKKIKPDAILCVICVTHYPPATKTYNLSVAPKSFYLTHQSLLSEHGCNLGIDLNRAAVNSAVQLVMNFTLEMNGSPNYMIINERFVHENLRRQGVMKMSSLALMSQLAEYHGDMIVKSASMHIATYKFVHGSDEGFGNDDNTLVKPVENSLLTILRNHEKLLLHLGTQKKNS